ncbi:Extracellular ligand-binding receptor [sediment metagenome]|uniref:Extracellular ligand-binding receptor n=1 Tax=sediment metagenome TaxID=749907 RepID=D9PFE0_9ZZZZ
MAKKLIVISLAVAAILLTMQCQIETEPKNDYQKQQKSIITIGVILPLTGPSFDGGQNVKRGIELALEELNHQYLKYHYNLVFEDSQYDPKTGVSATKKLIGVDHVKYIIGPQSSSVALAMAPVVEENKVILMSTGAQSDTISDAGDYIFRVQTNTKQEAEFFAEYIHDQTDHEKIDLLVMNTAYANSLIDAFVRQGIYFNQIEKFDSKETDFRTHLNRIKNCGSKYLLLGATRDTGGLILKQAKEMGLDIKFFATSPIAGEELIKTADAAADGLIYPYPYDVESEESNIKSFKQKYFERYGSSNDLYAANGYDAMKILSSCIEQVGDDVAKVKSCLYGIQDYHGASGTFTFDENGDAIKDFIIMTIKDGKFTRYTE